MMFPQSTDQMGWHVAVERWGSHAGSVAGKAAPHHHTSSSSSMLQGGNHTCRWDPFTPSVSRVEVADAMKHLRFGPLLVVGLPQLWFLLSDLTEQLMGDVSAT